MEDNPLHTTMAKNLQYHGKSKHIIALCSRVGRRWKDHVEILSNKETVTDILTKRVAQEQFCYLTVRQ